jgi:hypothetical protein
VGCYGMMCGECPEIYKFTRSQLLCVKLLYSFHVKYERFLTVVLELWHIVFWKILTKFSEECTAWVVRADNTCHKPWKALKSFWTVLLCHAFYWEADSFMIFLLPCLNPLPQRECKVIFSHLGLSNASTLITKCTPLWSTDWLINQYKSHDGWLLVQNWTYFQSQLENMNTRIHKLCAFSIIVVDRNTDM